MGAPPRTRQGHLNLTTHKMKKRGLRVLVALVAIVDIALAAGLAYTVNRDMSTQRMQRDALAKRIGITAETEEALASELYAQAVGEAMKHVTMENEVRVKYGMAAINLSNAEAAEYAVMLRLVDMDSDQTLLETGALLPGYRLESMALGKALGKGRYQCLAELTFYTVEDGVLVGNAARQNLLIVE